MRIPALCFALVPLLLAACAGGTRSDLGSGETLTLPADMQVATFGAGCFWCSEAAFEQVEGVVDVRSGFMGGAEDVDPDDADALLAAGHAEVVQVTFDPERTSYTTLLDWFWRIHDPTSVNRQGEDEGPEYRSEVFVHSDEQRAAAEASRSAAGADFERPIVTTITAAGRFFEASGSHQDYYRRNRATQYCQRVIAPHLRDVGLED